MSKEIQLDKLINSLPTEFKEKNDLDVIFLTSSICQDYDLTFGELDEIFAELYDIFTGNKDTTMLSKRIKENLNEDHKEFTNKLVDEIQSRVISPMVKALGNNFPILAPTEENKTDYKVIEGESLDRDSILQEIENPIKAEPKTVPLSSTNLGVEPERMLEEIYPEIQKAERSLPKHEEKPREVGSIIEQKMSGVTSLPKVETVVRPSPQVPKPLTKSYSTDPYRETLK